ncbi:MAG: intradiol ring-cleavage dioxygenase [Betaproteobacteria bacterium]|nr:intradiol ring-cleavage dioxygenase [Betaproteobacteria bacterium]
MIIETQQDVTTAVLAEMQRTPDARSKQILDALVRHLHGFVREVKLTEREFQEAVRQIARLGQMTTASHNEVMLIMGALGVSNLVCLLNNGAGGTQPTQANNLGPFWREGSPPMANGDTLLRSPTGGDPLFFNGQVRDAAGAPVAGAEVDVWHSSPVGLYENQDTEQAEMNLRGRLTTDTQGRFSFRSVKPGAYPVPIEGPTGDLLKAQQRHNWRPAHLHFLIFKPGYKTIASQVYSNDDQYLQTDSQFGVTKALIGNYVRHAGGGAPASDVQGAWYSLEHGFTIEPGEARLPKAPISGKVQKAA